MKKKEMDQANVPSDIKVMVVGNAGVGKSCIVKRFLKKPLDAEYRPTKQDVYSKLVEVDGQSYQVEIFDTAGFYSVAAYRDSLYKCSDGFVLTFSISDEESFNNLNFLQNRIRINRPDASLILVGNKKDLRESREITEQEGADLAAKYRCPYYESSALFDDNISPIFQSLVREVAKQRKQDLLLSSAKNRKDKSCKLM
ncbi:hypothetical protein ACHWQZ_G019189 [Mnemiopsis leidyi]